MKNDAAQLAHQGFVMVSQRNFDAGLILLKKAIELQPDWPEVLLTIGHVIQLQGNIEGGEPYFSKALAIEPNRPYTQAKLGRIAFWRGNRNKALSHYKAAIKLSATPPPSCFVDQIIEPLDQTLRSCYRLIFEILTDNDQFDEMEQFVEEGCSRFPDAPELHLAAGTALIASGSLDKAADHFKRLAKIPSNPSLVADAGRHMVLCEWMQKALAQIVPEATKTYKAQSRPPFVLAIAVWGEPYVKEFLETYLQSMNAPGNLPQLAEAFDVRIAIVTTAQGRQQIQESGIEERLSGIAAFDYLLMPTGMVSKTNHGDSSKFIYRTYILGNHVAIAYAQAIGAGVSLSIPDGIIANGSYGRIASLAKETDIEAIFAQAPPVQEETFLADIALIKDKQDGAICLGNRELMEIAAQHMHPFVEQRIVCPSNNNFSLSRSALFWWIPDGLLCHTFHWHPIYISAKRLAQYDKFRYVSIDGVLPQLLFPDSQDWAKIHLITDTDEFGFTGTIQAERQFPTTGRPFDVDDYVAYFKNSEQLRDIGRWFFKHPIHLKGFRPKEIGKDQMTYDPKIINQIAGLP